MIRKLLNLSAHALLVVALFGASFVVRAQNSDADAAAAAKVTTELLSVLRNQGLSAPLTAGDLSVDNQLVVVGNEIAIEAVAAPGQDGQTLLAQLQAQGLRNGVAYQKMVFGYLPISQLASLRDVSSLQYARPYYKPATNVGAVTSQGDQALRADVARTTYSVTGAGSKVGVLSDTYNALGGAPAGVASGDLPPGVQVLEDLASGSDEGRAMAEIVYDVAPGSAIAFNTAFNGQAGFAQGIKNLATAGCNIIVDDIIYFAEPFFQDGIIAQAVDDVVNNNGVTYFSSAGNQARSSYQAAFSNSGTTLSGGVAHNFGGGDVLQRITIPAGGSIRLAFQWDDPFLSAGGAGAQTNMDILVYLTNGTLLTSTTTNNITTGDPFEFVTITNNGAAAAAVDVAFIKRAGPDPTLIKWVNFGSRGITIEYDTKSSASYGHSNSARAISVGAAPYFNTPAFNSGLTTAILEPFSSAGGTPTLFNTAGVRLGTPITRQKPEITSVDGGNNTFFGSDSGNDADSFPEFFGTSASAPHAAGVAALMKQKVPTITRNTILSTLQSTALDMDDPAFAGFETGFDFGTGFGFIQADRALQAISTPANAAPTVANAIAPQSATVGQPFTFVIPANTFADPNNDPLTLTVSGLPMGLSFSSSTSAITGTPSMTGVSTVTVRATDPGSLSVSTTFTITVNPAATTPPPTPGVFSITAVTTVSCVTVTASERQITFAPRYAGTTGQPISFSVANELPATTSAGPYGLRLYTDNPVITLVAAQSGTAGVASFSYNWLAACGSGTPPPPPTPTPGMFSITAVTTVSCVTVTASERRLTFNPQYAGTTGQPINFSVLNELPATTSAGPYVLRLYTDNPVITLKATQAGTAGEASFVYNWLAACGSGSSARLGVGGEGISKLKATLYPNPVGEEFSVGVEGAQGQTVRFEVSDLTGRPVVSQSAEVSTSRHVERVRLAQSGTGLYLLRVSAGQQALTLKIIKR